MRLPGVRQRFQPNSQIVRQDDRTPPALFGFETTGVLIASRMEVNPIPVRALASSGDTESRPDFDLRCQRSQLLGLPTER